MFLFVKYLEKYCVISLQVKFHINFEYSLDQLEDKAILKFVAKRYTEL